MGYSLPASVGAAFASSGSRIICITGDGGLQINIWELQTILEMTCQSLFSYLIIILTVLFKGHKTVGLMADITHLVGLGNFPTPILH